MPDPTPALAQTHTLALILGFVGWSAAVWFYGLCVGRSLRRGWDFTEGHAQGWIDRGMMDSAARKAEEAER